MYSSTLPSTSALDWGVGGWSTPRPGRFTAGKDLVPPLGFDPQTVQPVASHYTDRTIPAPNKFCKSAYDYGT